MDINELESFNLSDAVSFHKELNPKLWEDNKLDPEVRNQLLLIAEDFVEYLGISNLKVKDVTISGSNAAYSYTPHSDLDLHVLVDFNELPNNEVYQELFTAKKTLYNDAHDITVRDVPVELYVQDTNNPVQSLGEYSIVHDKWIRIPKKRRANFDQAATKLKYEKLGELIELALKTKDSKKVNDTIALIKRYRKSGLDKAGEFGPENLAYKAVRKQGLVQALHDLKVQLHTEKLSIDEYANEDYDPNGPPPGPEFKPTMPAGTVRVDVSDVYDWYKLGQHISNMKGLGKHDFGQGPPSTILSFGDEDTEHKYIKDLEKTGLTTTDIDPVDPNQPKGMKRQKTDPTFNVNETDKIKLSTDPNWYGADVGDYKASGPVVNISAAKLVGFEPDEKMSQPKSKANVKKIVAGLKKGDKLPPILVRKYKDGYQVVDGHHRFWAYKLLGVKSIPSQIVPDSDIEEKGKKEVSETADKKAAVLKIQKHLNKKYGANLDLDGKLGPLTLKSINKFMPRAKSGLADEPNKTTAVQGKKLKEASDYSQYENKIQNFVQSLNPDDVGVEQIGPYHVHFEGFTDECQQDAERRCNLPSDNPRHLANYDDVYKEVIRDFVRREGGKKPLKVGFAGYQDYPVIYAVFDNPEPYKNPDAWNPKIDETVDAHTIYSDVQSGHREPDDFVEGDIGDRIYWFDDYKLTSLPISNLNLDEHYVDDDLVDDYVEHIKDSPKTMPPIVYDPIAKSIIDGIHRANAYANLGYDTIPAYVGLTKSSSYGEREGDNDLYEASGYIPAAKEKNDPRFKTALTVDVKPDAIKKNAKAFGFKTSRAGIPPQARADGKINENVSQQSGSGSQALVNEFLSTVTNHERRLYAIRDNCGPAASDMRNWLENTKGIKTKRVRGEFVADDIVSKKADFTPDMKKEFISAGLDWNSPEDRYNFIKNNPKYATEWKKIPHYWLTDKSGEIYDPTGYIQFINTGLATDLNKRRYIPESQARADGKIAEDLMREFKTFLGEQQEEMFPGYDEQHREKRLGNWLAKSWGVQNGKPQTFYHATTKDFDTFNTHGTGFASALGMAYEVERHGSFFAVDPKFAEGFIEDPNTGRVKEGGRVLPVHLSIQSPIDLRDDALSRMLSDEETVAEFKANDIDLRSIYNHFYELERWELFDGPEGAEFIDNLQKLGFDGAIINEAIPNNSNAKSGQVWVAFSPNQVKSVYNRGSFSPDDPRLTKESG